MKSRRRSAWTPTRAKNYGWSLVLGALLLVACGEEDDKNTEAACGSYAEDAKPFVQKYCLGCHSESKTGNLARMLAPSDANFDTEALLFEHGHHIYERVTPDTEEGIMPPEDGKSAQPTAPEREAFLTWMECSGAAESGEHEH